MWYSIIFWRCSFFPFALLLGLARLAEAQAPSFDMAVVCGSPRLTAGSLFVQALTTDYQGNTIVAGAFDGSVSFGGVSLSSSDGDVFVAKRTATGTWLWASQGGGTGYDSGLGLTVDVLGQIYVTGSFGAGTGSTYTPATFGTTVLTSTSEADAFVAKLDGTSGQWQWATSAGAGTANGLDEKGIAIVADSFGGLLLTGSFGDFRLLAGGLTLYQVGTGTNLFVARLEAATGAWIWATNPGPASAPYLAIDGQGNGYLSGSFGSSLTLGATTLTNARGGFVAKISPAGSWLWGRPLVGSLGAGTNASSGQTYAGGVGTDAQGHVYLSGSFNGATASFGSTVLTNASTSYQGPQVGTVQLGDAYVARLDAGTGQWQWAVRAGGSDDESFTHLAVQNGRVLVGGSFGRGTMLDAGTPSPAGSSFGPVTLVSAGQFDAVVAALADDGVWQWAVRAGGIGTDATYRVASDAAGRVMLVARCGPAQFGTYSVPGSYAVLARLAGGALAMSPAGAASPFTLYPNPARVLVTLTGLPAWEPVQVLDILGRLVLMTRTPTQGPLELVLPPGLAPGLYVVRAAGQARQLLVSSTI